MSDQRLPSKYARERDRLLRKFGYRYEGLQGNGHLRYLRDGWEPLILPGSPRSEFAVNNWLRYELRKRHPHHPTVRSKGKHRRPHSSPAARRRRARNRAVASLRAAERETAERAALRAAQRRAAARMDVPERTCCGSCGRRWLSDLDPAGRSCPQCGGEIVLGLDRRVPA